MRPSMAKFAVLQTMQQRKATIANLDLLVAPHTDGAIVFDGVRFYLVWFLVCGFRVSTILALCSYCLYFNFLRFNENFQREWRREVHAPSPRAILRFFLFLVLVIGMHVYKLAQMLHASYLERRLVFHVQADNFQADEHSPVSSKTSSMMMVASFTNSSRYQSLTMASRRQSKGHLVKYVLVKLLQGIVWIVLKLCWLYDAVMQLLVVLGIRSQWFDEVFTTRESVELVLQTIQVARTCALIHSDTINAAMVITLLINSVSTLVVERISGRRHRDRLRTRLTLLLADACLDFTFCVVIPFASAVPYLYNIDYTIMTFKDIIYDDVWRASMYRQVSQFTVNYTSDQVSAVVFHLGLLYCLRKTQYIIDRAESRVATVHQHHSNRSSISNRFASARIGWIEVDGPVPPVALDASQDHFKLRQHPHHPTHGSNLREVTNATQAVSRPRRWIKACLRYAPYLHAVGGIITTTASIHARYFTATDVVGCQAYTYEWFTSTASCMVMEINCYRRQITGQASEIEQILMNVNRKWTQTLLINHCPALTMPPTIRLFHQLFSIHTYNCTMVDWPANASVTGQDNPLLTDLRFVRTNFTNGMLPLGLQQEDFPTSVSNIILIATNLVTLPSELHKSWRNHLVLTMEHGVLEEFPLVLGKMTTMTSLSLVENKITEVPSGVLDTLRLQYLYLSGNPLQKLPAFVTEEAFGPTSSIALERTEMTSIPRWVETNYKQAVALKYPDTYSSLYRSPMCSIRSTRTMAQHANDMSSIEWLNARCFTDAKTSLGWYHLDTIELYRAL